MVTGLTPHNTPLSLPLPSPERDRKDALRGAFDEADTSSPSWLANVLPRNRAVHEPFRDVGEMSGEVNGLILMGIVRRERRERSEMAERMDCAVLILLPLAVLDPFSCGGALVWWNGR